uniref:histidine kinase n=1 Tax=Desulfatirhabdium butyrativorans TaxID=340467 RepID=A0A7C4MNN4_9BACT
MDPKEIAERLSDISERYRMITENMVDTVWVMDMDFRFIYVSPSVQRMYGVSAQEVIGQPVHQSLTPESLEHALTVFQEEVVLEESGIADPNRTRTIELEEYRQDGSTIWVESTLSFLRDETGKPIGVLGVSRDITRRKQAEAEQVRLESLNRQLQRAESLGRMAAAIAHHFNNQLQIIIGGLELVVGRMPEGSDTCSVLVHIQEAARKAAEISRMMLTYVGQTTGSCKQLDLSELCRNSLPFLQAAAPKGLVIETAFPSAGPFIEADDHLIRQVLTNVVVNAWEASADSDNSIRITLETVPSHDIGTSRRFPPDWHPEHIRYACLTVEDHGCGILPKDIESIFDPFYSTKFIGRGMGLATVLGLLKAYRGCITVESEVNIGSIFRIFLPLDLSEPTVAEPTVKPTVNTSKGRILLIDDEHMVRDIADMMFKRLGYDVLQAANGKQAIALFEQHHATIDAVICDLTMPDMNGWDVLTALRSIDPKVKVVLSSGYDEATVMAEAHAERPDGFLGKPYRMQELSACMQAVSALPDDFLSAKG